VFAPVIEYLINMVYQLMRAIQSVVYAFSGINIFAKSTASSMGKTASNAKKASNSLAGTHGEINNVSTNDSGGGASASGAISPSMDLSQVDSSMNNCINSIKEKLIILFEPIQSAWNSYGTPMIESIKNALNSIWELIKGIGKSFAEVWTNGTGEATISLILQILTCIFDIISSITNSWTNAWNNGNGTTIIQNLWNALNNILETIRNIGISIEEWWQSDEGQAWSNAIVSVFATISGWIETITTNIKKIWDNGGSHVFTSLSNLASNLAVAFDGITQAIDPLVKGIINLSGDAFSGLLDVIGTIIDKFNEFIEFFTEENKEKLDGWAIIIGSIATAIGLVVGAIAVWNVISFIATGIAYALGIAIAFLTSPITLVILAIAALIAIIVAIVIYWDEISAALSAGWEWIKQKAEEIFNAIAEFFQGIWQGICDTVTTIWNSICDFFNGIWDWMVQTVTNTFNNIKQFISDVLNGISTIWNNIWQRN